ncbi:hypothetical protein [Polynucleobacter sp. Tro8-14-1]|uniref:hypothetical protein n=1 Tax=Polynucleobacter sp. Tro8-14-1 TaxID=1758383 RepID=UPI001C0C919C|nr:hypothetical protein [Polynucleobacter sp. Tro8-14-1]MBU3562839.1 hypothetical protein [Polynucleobacter sp. Tro8-14-1]
MKKLLIAFTTVTILSACAQMQTVNIATPFDAKEASVINQVGKNTITGSALIKRNDGQTVTCSGEEVNLIPYTTYANTRILALYGNSSKGINTYNRPTFVPDVAEYKTMQKHTQCNAQGFFSFKNVADGDYFVVTAVRWTVNYATQGGSLMRRVAVKGGETAEIVLAP